MSYQNVDKEIAHLEHVFRVISGRDRFPLSYWQKRLHALRIASMMPTQRQRVVRLEATLRLLAESWDGLNRDLKVRAAA
jgi:hypothetical protein